LHLQHQMESMLAKGNHKTFNFLFLFYPKFYLVDSMFLFRTSNPTQVIYILCADDPSSHFTLITNHIAPICFLEWSPILVNSPVNMLLSSDQLGRIQVWKQRVQYISSLCECLSSVKFVLQVKMILLNTF
jgi:hypothetical protein